MSLLEENFAYLWEEYCNVDLYREVRFACPRRYRADFMNPSSKIIIEIQGGTWSKRKMGHNSGSGIQRDAEKMRLAATMGFHLIPLIDKDLTREVLLDIESLIEDMTPSERELGEYLKILEKNDPVLVFDDIKLKIQKCLFLGMEEKKVNFSLKRKVYRCSMDCIILPRSWPRDFFNKSPQTE